MESEWDTPLALWVVMAKPEAVMRAMYNVCKQVKGGGVHKQGGLRNAQVSPQVSVVVSS